jgi:hypothetical protein
MACREKDAKVKLIYTLEKGRCKEALKSELKSILYLHWGFDGIENASGETSGGNRA